MAKNDQNPSNDGMSRKERRAAERAARKSGTGGSGSSKSSPSSGPSMMVISVAAVVIGLIAVLGLVVISGGLGNDAAAVSEPDFAPPAEELRVGRSLGDPDAPVLVEAFEDPQCPVCGVFTERIEPLLIGADGPVADGTAFFTYKDFAFIGPESFDGAVAMRVAEEMDGKFWDYHDVLYFNQGGENQGDFSTERLADMAELVGLDRERFIAELDDPKYLEAVEAEGAEGRERGVNSTPTIFVNGQVVGRGVPSWEDLSAAIEAAAAEARQAAAGASPEPVANTTADPVATVVPEPEASAPGDPVATVAPNPVASTPPAPVATMTSEAAGASVRPGASASPPAA